AGALLPVLRRRRADAVQRHQLDDGGRDAHAGPHQDRRGAADRRQRRQGDDHQGGQRRGRPLALHRVWNPALASPARAPTGSETMNKKPLLARGTFVVLGIIATLAARQPERGERAGDHPRPLPTLTPAEINTLVVTRSGSPTTLRNEGGVYKVVVP